MKARLPIPILLSLLTTAPLATANCDPLPTLEISDVHTTLVGNEWKEDRVIEATATKDGKPLPLAIVRLYIGRVLVQWTMADKRGHFLLEPLTVGPYTLSIQGIGQFPLEVTPPRIHQQGFYSFYSNHGCLGWGEEFDARAWFNSPEEPAAFRETHPDYAEDVIVLCPRCGIFTLAPHLA